LFEIKLSELFLVYGPNLSTELLGIFLNVPSVSLYVPPMPPIISGSWVSASVISLRTKSSLENWKSLFEIIWQVNPFFMILNFTKKTLWFVWLNEYIMYDIM
jgi:hypothetical protein